MMVGEKEKGNNGQWHKVLFYPKVALTSPSHPYHP